jgi:hypothetical protein
MLRSKTLLLFLLKAIIIYGLLSVPLSFYDDAYGTFYRKVSEIFFTRFGEKGFVKFREWKEPATTHVNVGSNALIRPDGSADTAAIDVNTRYLGYIPTILLIALVLASPVPWKRRLFALAAGLVLVTLLVMLKQWIALLWLCEQHPFLQLTNFTGTGKKLLTFANSFLSVTSSSVLYFVVAIWLVVTFRVDDFGIKTETK